VVQEGGCANCHGILQPGGRQAPELLRIAHGRSAADLLADLWNHVPQMMAALLAGDRLPSPSAEGLRNLVGYLCFLNYLGSPGNAERGAAALAQMPCLACHDLRARGKIGPALVVADRAASSVGLVTDLWNHYPPMHAALKERGLPWFAWTGDQITDMSRYLGSLVPAGSPPPLLAPGDPQDGDRVFVRLGCGSCHNPSGGEAWTVWLRKSNSRSAADNGAALLSHLPKVYAGGHASLPPLSEREMADLLAYLSLAGTDLSGGDARAGQNVFDVKGCRTCHALAGDKPGVGPSVQDMPAIGDPYDLAALMLQHAGNMRTVTELRQVPWPQMKADELLDLYAFVASQPRR
jgi:cytochrome c551/c552